LLAANASPSWSRVAVADVADVPRMFPAPIMVTSAVVSSITSPLRNTRAGCR
jgi:hypothetical protein